MLDIAYPDVATNIEQSLNEDTDNISIEDEKAMEDEISAAFSNLNIDDMNINDLSAMLQEFNF